MTQAMLLSAMFPFTTQHPPLEQLVRFLDTLHPTGNLVEIRAIETWAEHGKKQSQLVDRFWLPPDDVVRQFDYFQDLNRKQAANIFFGVNSRSKEGAGTKDAVANCRCVWMDMDAISRSEFQDRLPPILRNPSIVVDSGHGIHAYWLLCEALDVSLQENREAFETMLQNLYADVGADATSDVSRLLRLPGFLNMKDCRNGKQPVPCTLIHWERNRTYPVDFFFECWGKHRSKEGPDREEQHVMRLANAQLRSHRTEQRIRGLVKYLDQETKDRSRRDFGVACALLRLGLSIDEITSLVGSHSKFVGNKQYLERTLQNAQAVINGG